MSLIQKFTNLFNKEEDIITSDFIFSDDESSHEVISCNTCQFYHLCEDKDNVDIYCQYIQDIPDYDPNRDSILLIDDNPGLVSFLEDDIEFISEQISIDLNIISVSSKKAAYIFEALMKKNKNLRIKYAVIDITLGGTRHTEKGMQKYTGVDVFDMLISEEPDIKYVFYTGNNLNTYIKSNKRLVNQFKDITNESIKKHVLFKTSMDMDHRREKIREILFDD